MLERGVSEAEAVEINEIEDLVNKASLSWLLPIARCSF